MGFFDKKRRDDEEEEAAPSEVLPPIITKSLPTPPPELLKATPPQQVDAAPPSLPKAPPPPVPIDPSFGIDDAVQLMRTLPNRNIDLVMQVVKRTLESVHVDVARIIEGATKKEQVIEDRIGTLKKEIEKLEATIAMHKKEIGGLDTDQKEVSTVKERLLLAQKVENEITSDRPTAPPKSVAPPPPPSPAPPAPPKTS